MKEITPNLEQLYKISQAEKKAGKQVADPSQSGAFEKLLAEELKGGGSPSGSIEEIGGLPELTGSLQAQWVEAGFDRTGFTQKLSDSIDLLDSYAGILGDPGKTLKQAWEVLTSLSEQMISMKTELDDAAQADPDQVDPELVQMLNQLMSTIRVEEIKINRGDYF